MISDYLVMGRPVECSLVSKKVLRDNIMNENYPKKRGGWKCYLLQTKLFR